MRFDRCKVTLKSEIAKIASVRTTQWRVYVTVRYLKAGKEALQFVLKNTSGRDSWKATVETLTTSMETCVDPSPDVLENIVVDNATATEEVDDEGEVAGELRPEHADPVGRALPVDVNHDGVTDFVYAAAGGESVQLAFGTSDGFAESMPPGENDPFSHDVAEDGASYFVIEDEDYDTWEDTVAVLNAETGTELALFRNLGGARFEDEPSKAILLPAHALGVGKCDFNDDGLTDYAICHSDGTFSIVQGGSEWSVNAIARIRSVSAASSSATRGL